MSGTDVALREEREGSPGEPAERGKQNYFLAFLRIWLPFPLILGGILLYQLRAGHLFAPPEKEEGTREGWESVRAGVPLLLHALEEERAQIRTERDELRFAERRILLERTEIEERKREVEALLARAQEQARGVEAERDRMLDQLARVYETMRAETAARILGGIDVDVSTEILRRMKARAAAEVLANLEPKSAALISERMLAPR